MSRPSRTQILWMCWLCLWISACGGISRTLESPTPVVTPPLKMQVMKSENVTDLAEVLNLTVDGAGPVASLMFTPDIQTLLAVYAHEGKLRHWRLTDGIVTKTLNVYPVGLGGAAFDAGGTMLATSAGAEWKEHVMDDAYLGWQVWNARSGEVIKQGGKYYDSFLTRSLIPAILLNHNGSWALMIRVSPAKDQISFKNFFIDGVMIDQTGDGYVNFSRRPEEDDFDVIAFDAQSEFFAAADEAGKVAIYAFRPPAYPRIAEAVIEQPRKELGPRPLALAFDPPRRWLAGVRGTELIVWDLQSFGYKRQIAAAVGQVAGITASLAFDPSGNLLGVGTANGWQIWDVNAKKLVAERTEVEVYAVAFSPDGRLFAWGDSSGVVHVWGIPDK